MGMLGMPAGMGRCRGTPDGDCRELPAPSHKLFTVHSVASPALVLSAGP